MQILLPPSETKRAGGAGALSWSGLHEDARLGPTRRRVLEALVELSTGDSVLAAKALKLGSKNRSELDHNRRLTTSGAMPAIERYTGVLYDALDAPSLEADARSWIDGHVLVQSALFGLVSAADRIPAYRLSAGTRLPSIAAPLKRVWSEAHAGLDWQHRFVLDLRSKDYVALAPLPAGTGRLLHVVQRGEDGEVRALNHFNKSAKGDLVRRLARSAPPISESGELLDWAASEGLEMSASADGESIVLTTELGAPSRVATTNTQAR